MNNAAEEVLKKNIVNTENGVTIEQYNDVKPEELNQLLMAMEEYSNNNCQEIKSRFSLLAYAAFLAGLFTGLAFPIILKLIL